MEWEFGCEIILHSVPFHSRNFKNPQFSITSFIKKTLKQMGNRFIELTLEHIRFRVLKLEIVFCFDNCAGYSEEKFVLI